MATEHFTPRVTPGHIAHASVRSFTFSFRFFTSIGGSATTALATAAVHLKLLQRIIGLRPAASVTEVSIRLCHTPLSSTSSQRPSLPRLPLSKLPDLRTTRGPHPGDDTLARGPLARDDTLARGPLVGDDTLGAHVHRAISHHSYSPLGYARQWSSRRRRHSARSQHSE